MNFSKFLYLLIFPLLLACSDPDDLSTCLDDKIENFKQENANCENSSIKKYSFQNETVYVLAQGICISDNAAQVYKLDCVELCLLGGIAGFIECNGENFYKNATVLETIWEAQ